MVGGKIKIISVVGTRPEAIKMAPVIKALKRYPNYIAPKLIVTAQHRDLLDQVLELFQISPHYDLNLMNHSQSPNQIISKLMLRLEPVLVQEQPDWILLQGDTTTSMATAVQAFHAQVKIGHVEAGLRTYDKWNPFPEEINRRIISLVADLHFVPTDLARQNLLNEGIDPQKIHVTGNTVIDALKFISKLQTKDLACDQLLPDNPNLRIVLLTAHRRENFGQGIRNICKAVKLICQRYGDNVHIIYPVHPNPNIREPVSRLLGKLRQIKITPPLDYHTLIQAMAHSYIIMTDSGGLQEEAPSLGKPVLVLRKTTERPEVISTGCGRLVGTDPIDIYNNFVELWENDFLYRKMARAINIYGNGKAADRIVDILLKNEFHSIHGHNPEDKDLFNDIFQVSDGYP